MRSRFKMKSQRISFVEVTLALAVLAILAALLIPFFRGANDKGKMTKWKGLRSELLLDNSLKSYFDFSDGEGIILTDSVKSVEKPLELNSDAKILNGGEWRKGRWGIKWAVAFNGESTYVHSRTALPKTGRTLILWFKTKNKDGGLFSATKSNNLSSKMFYSLLLSQGKVVSSTLKGNVKSNVEVADDNWHMVAVTEGMKYNKHILYIDGVKSEAIESFSKLENPEQENIFLGFSNNSPYFRGMIDELLIFDRELSPQEIKNIYSTVTQ